MKARKSSKDNRAVPTWIGFAVATGVFGAPLWLERRRPLRRETESKLTSNGRNVAVAIGSALVTNLAERPLALSSPAASRIVVWGCSSKPACRAGSKRRRLAYCSITRSISGIT